MADKVLLVDDDPNVLAGIRRQLHRRIPVTTKDGPLQGIEAVRNEGPFAVVVSDMRMPQQSGVEFLRAVQEASPDTTRIMLTGNADLQTAIDAVNQGHIFRFLTKPCATPNLIAALEAGLAQYHLVTAERQLLSQTLTASVKVLVDVLSLANPEAFGRANRVRKWVRMLVEATHPENAWECELAALLSQMGCVSVAPEILAKQSDHAALSLHERQLLNSHPKTGHDLIVAIPRMEGVAKMVLLQNKHFDGTGFPADNIAGDAIPWGARVLAVCNAFENLLVTGLSQTAAWAELARQTGIYDPQILEKLYRLIEREAPVTEALVEVRSLPIGGTLLEHVVSSGGVILVSAGHEITTSMRLRLLAFRQGNLIREPIKVAFPRTAALPETAAAPPETTAVVAGN